MSRKRLCLLVLIAVSTTVLAWGAAPAATQAATASDRTTKDAASIGEARRADDAAVERHYQRRERLAAETNAAAQP